jgi:hypothetical protein
VRVINLRTPLAHKQIILEAKRPKATVRNCSLRSGIASHPAPRVAPISGTDLPGKDRASSARGFVGTLRLRSALNCHAKD